MTHRRRIVLISEVYLHPLQLLCVSSLIVGLDYCLCTLVGSCHFVFISVQNMQSEILVEFTWNDPTLKCTNSYKVYLT